MLEQGDQQATCIARRIRPELTWRHCIHSSKMTSLLCSSLRPFLFYVASAPPHLITMAAVHSLLTSLPNQFAVAGSGVNSRSPVLTIKASSKGVSLVENGYSRRKQILVGVGAFASIFSWEKIAFAEEVPKNYEAFVDFIDGYTYYYPSDWRDFDFMGHDSAFKDRFAALQHVRVSFIPTEKRDVHDLGPMEEVIFNLVKNVYAAPNQTPTIYEMQERSADGKNYWTFEYELATPFFGRTAFATIAIGNGRYYTLVVGANERRWSRVRNKLKVVADSFKILDI